MLSRPGAIRCAFCRNHIIDSKRDVCSTDSTPVGGLRSLIFHCFHGHPSHQAEPGHMSVVLLWACAVEGTVSGKGNKAIGSGVVFDCNYVEKQMLYQENTHDKAFISLEASTFVRNIFRSTLSIYCNMGLLTMRRHSYLCGPCVIQETSYGLLHCTNMATVHVGKH
jgi:hypothetical protein